MQNEADLDGTDLQKMQELQVEFVKLPTGSSAWPSSMRVDG